MEKYPHDCSRMIKRVEAEEDGRDRSQKGLTQDFGLHPQPGEAF